MAARTWRELFPEGRMICYEGEDPASFAAAIKAEFGFDPSEDVSWDSGALLSGGGHQDPFGRTYWFLCPPEHLDAIYGSDRWMVGS